MKTAGDEIFEFRLYIAGDAVNSSIALANLRELCRAHLAGRHSIDVVDVFREPDRALADGIFMTPMLIRLTPPPVCKVIGTLSDTVTLMHALGLPVDMVAVPAMP